jgi:pimeloyl-ACP methyl ester carboxylesterase
MEPRKHWRGLKALLHDAVDHTTTIVGDAHEQVARHAMSLISLVEPIAGPARTVDDVRRVTTEGVLASVRMVNRAVEKISDAGIDLVDRATTEPGAVVAVPMRSDVTDKLPWAGDAALGAVNGVVGDYLRSRLNGLDLGMVLRFQDRYLDGSAAGIAEAFAGATPKLVVFVHGLACTEWSWCLNSAEYHGDPAASFGTLMARDLGVTPVYLRYNTGRHVSENGRDLARLLQAVVDSYPGPLDEIVLIGHSMGGLVARSACHYASEESLPWVLRLARVFCLGTPHRGAALEKIGNVVGAVLSLVDLPGTTIPAKIIAARSAGIKDLRFGYVVDEEWLDRDPDALLDNQHREIPLVPHAAYYFISATASQDPEHPVGRLIGDLLVRTPSASGPAEQDGHFSIETRTYGGVLHHHLQNHPDVYAMILRACRGEAIAAPGPA